MASELTASQAAKLRNEYIIQTKMAGEYAERSDEYARKRDIALATATGLYEECRKNNIEV